jgi:Zn-dependent peptidase ImmA (M78 family)
MTVRRRHIRALAERLLLANRIETAPVDAKQVAKSLGAEVQYQPADENLSGFILRNRKRRSAIIGVNSNHHPNRQRFTIAHEVGHFLLHDHDDIHVDHMDCGLIVRRRNEDSSKGEDDYEKEANLFAAELLMPAAFLEPDIAALEARNLLDDDVLHSLADKYGVSTQALTYRLAYLGYIQLS